MTATPRVDEWLRNNQNNAKYRDIDILARELERELAETRAKLEAAERDAARLLRTLAKVLPSAPIDDDDIQWARAAIDAAISQETPR